MCECYKLLTISGTVLNITTILQQQIPMTLCFRSPIIRWFSTILLTRKIRQVSLNTPKNKDYLIYL